MYFQLKKSSYCYQAIAINNDKYAHLKIKVKNTFEESSSRYRYRRIHSVISSLGTIVKVYLSPIINCFDGLPVSWTIGTSPSSELVNTMLDEAIQSLSEIEKPILHSDRGCHYRWPGWIERTEKARTYMLKCPRKAAHLITLPVKAFLEDLKTRCFMVTHGQVFHSIGQFIKELDKYIKWYDEKQIKLSLGGMSPLN